MGWLVAKAQRGGDADQDHGDRDPGDERQQPAGATAGTTLGRRRVTTSQDPTPSSTTSQRASEPAIEPQTSQPAGESAREAQDEPTCSEPTTTVTAPVGCSSITERRKRAFRQRGYGRMDAFTDPLAWRGPIPKIVISRSLRNLKIVHYWILCRVVVQIVGAPNVGCVTTAGVCRRLGGDSRRGSHLAGGGRVVSNDVVNRMAPPTRRERVCGSAAIRPARRGGSRSDSRRRGAVGGVAPVLACENGASMVNFSSGGAWPPSRLGVCGAGGVLRYQDRRIRRRGWPPQHRYASMYQDLVVS